MTGVLTEYPATYLAGVRERFAGIGVAQLSDAATGYTRVLPVPFAPRTPATHVCGPVFPVETDNDMLPCLQALAAAPPGWVVLIANRTSPSEALVGDIYTLAAQTQGGAVFKPGHGRSSRRRRPRDPERIRRAGRRFKDTEPRRGTWGTTG